MSFPGIAAPVCSARGNARPFNSLIKSLPQVLAITIRVEAQQGSQQVPMCMFSVNICPCVESYYSLLSHFWESFKVIRVILRKMKSLKGRGKNKRKSYILWKVEISWLPAATQERYFPFFTPNGSLVSRDECYQNGEC